MLLKQLFQGMSYFQNLRKLFRSNLYLAMFTPPHNHRFPTKTRCLIQNVSDNHIPCLWTFGQYKNPSLNAALRTSGLISRFLPEIMAGIKSTTLNYVTDL
ncbi:hypothetical protein RIF29_15853 [Crotalaria pallida]|uniref:Uncharacterized protein n=1 Tax=Crotalaria pallida TaxID=3830 RepID=A0AAN9FJV2_CROPI